MKSDSSAKRTKSDSSHGQNAQEYKAHEDLLECSMRGLTRVSHACFDWSTQIKFKNTHVCPTRECKLVHELYCKLQPTQPLPANSQPTMTDSRNATSPPTDSIQQKNKNKIKTFYFSTSPTYCFEQLLTFLLLIVWPSCPTFRPC